MDAAAPRLRHITPSTRHGHWPEYTCRRGAPGARRTAERASGTARAQRSRQRPWSRGAAPPNSGEPPSLAITSVKPELFRPGRKNLGGFFLFGKLDAFYSSLGRILRLFLHPWLIGVQSAGDEFYQTTESPSRTETFRVFCASCEERRKMLVTVRKPDGP